MPDLSDSLRRRVLDAARAAERDRSAGLSVAELAEHAGLSDKHFQRCFRQVIGESPKSYVRRLRLQSAAYLLRWSDVEVTEIALAAGFSTHSGFSKAFARAYGKSPTAFRNDQAVAPYLSRDDRASGGGVGGGNGGGDDGEFDFRSVRANKLMVRLREVPARRVAAMRHIGPLERTAEVWPRMVAWAQGRGLINRKSELLGVHNDYWDDNAQDRYRYDAAIVVPDDFEGDDQAATFHLAGGTVAMTEFRGSLAEADRAWRRLVDQWLPVSGYTFAQNYAYDRYPVDLVAPAPLRAILNTFTGLRATLCLPVKQ